MSFLASTVNAGHLVGILGSGFVAGFSFSASHIGAQSILKSESPAKYAAPTWNLLYTRGLPVAVGTILIAAPGYFFAAYKTYNNPLLGKTVLGLNPASQLALAGILLITALPFTAIAMVPGIKRLQADVKTIEANGYNSTEVNVGEARVKADIKAWSAQNSVRAALFTTAFILGVTA